MEIQHKLKGRREPSIAARSLISCPPLLQSIPFFDGGLFFKEKQSKPYKSPKKSNQL